MSGATTSLFSDAHMPTVLGRADALMKNEHVSWIGTATKLHDLIRDLTYAKTPVDCLLSDLRVAWECGYLTGRYWKDRMTEFWAEVEPDAE